MKKTGSIEISLSRSNKTFRPIPSLSEAGREAIYRAEKSLKSMKDIARDKII